MNRDRSSGALQAPSLRIDRGTGACSSRNTNTPGHLFSRRDGGSPATAPRKNADNFSYGPSWAQILQFNLKRLGIDVKIKIFPRSTYFGLIGTRGTPFDIALGGGWTLDYPDPVTIFGPLLDGHNLTKTGNSNSAYFDRPKYNREIQQAASLTGAARRRAWAALDIEMMRDDPPWAPVINLTGEDFVSRSFGCYISQPVIGLPDLSAACKK